MPKLTCKMKNQSSLQRTFFNALINEMFVSLDQSISWWKQCNVFKYITVAKTTLFRWKGADNIFLTISTHDEQLSYANHLHHFLLSRRRINCSVQCFAKWFLGLIFLVLFVEEVSKIFPFSEQAMFVVLFSSSLIRFALGNSRRWVVSGWVTGLGLEHFCEKEESVWERFEGSGNSSGIQKMWGKGESWLLVLPLLISKYSFRISGNFLCFGKKNQ